VIDDKIWIIEYFLLARINLSTSDFTARIGIDLGGTKIEGICLALNGDEVLRNRINTPQSNCSDRYVSILQSICDLVHDIESTSGLYGTVGIGIPGTVSVSTGKVKNANTTELIGMPLDKDLENLLGRDVRIENDANCFALSEAVDGAAKECDVVFGVIIGTGTGGGIVIDKKVVKGINGISGEWGHNALPWPDENELKGNLCYCGKSGCIETFLSGPALRSEYRDVCGEFMDPSFINKEAISGNECAERVMVNYETRLAKGLASIINVIDPDAIVLGGGLSNISRLYSSVPKIWKDYVFSDDCFTKLLKADYGDSSGVRGAAWLWNE